jgi:hypothetical protein
MNFLLKNYFFYVANLFPRSIELDLQNVNIPYSDNSQSAMCIDLIPS